ncbi:sugar phosphate isomerase/epimerase family protein [Pedobacter nyackensis]|uniref:sugar phosphate isomerase/epimerase family protein n=1 Tax=Pedobacter nyackensis TaxID=475255 RepID=UPI00292CB3AF|nr:sugar phosphate isomerase/epimerase family protein [Pedobacter nyackensis]
MMTKDRRSFIKDLGMLTGAAAFGSLIPLEAFSAGKKEFFKISLAQWSLHKTLFGGKLTNLDFPLKAKNDFGINIVEYVSPFFNKKETDQAYLKELLTRTKNEGIQNHLIMIDGEGHLGDKNEVARTKAVENHYKWIDAAKFLGCKTIRVNAAGDGSAEDVKMAAVDGLGRLSEYGKKNKINVIVENHGGYSSNGSWLSSLIKEVNNPYCGTLPDFGNFRISATESYDKYKGVEELLPYAKGLSAKSHDFDEQGNEVGIDYDRMFKIAKAGNWSGIVGIEYEGSRLSEDEGIRKTKVLLEKILKNYK